MSKSSPTMRHRCLTLALTIFTLSTGWSGTVMAAPWDDLLKKATDVMTETVDKVVDKVVDNTFDKEKDAADKANDEGDKKPQQQPPVQSADAPRYDKPWVTEIQTHLTSLGYDPGPADGAFGNKSRMAIIAFQQQRGDQGMGLPTPSVMQALRGASQAASSNPDPGINNPSPATGGQAATPVSSSTQYPPQYLEGLADTAGEYAAWADACNDPEGVTVKSDLVSRADVMTPGEKADIIQRFDKRYAQRKDYAENRVKQCTAMGKTDCCALGKFHTAKIRYQRSLEETVATATSTSVLTTQNLKRFTNYAAKYSAWADACSDPTGVAVRNDFLSKVDVLAPGEKANFVQKFEKQYAKTKYKAEKFAKQCAANGAIDCCAAGTRIEQGMSKDKRYYQAFLKKFPVTAAAKKSSGASTASVVPALTALTPSALQSVSSPIPATTHALNALVNYAANWAGYATACDEPATVKQDYLAAANSLAPQYRASVIKTFNSGHDGAMWRIEKAQAAMLLKPGTRGAGGTDPCTDERRDDLKGKYEWALQGLQKSDATQKANATPASPAVSGTSAVNPVATHKPGTGTMTLDGETHSFVFEKCGKFSSRGKSYQVQGRTKGGSEPLLTIKFVPGLVFIGVSRIEPERINITYVNRENNPAVYRVNGSTVSVDGAFKTLKAPVTSHSIQMSFDCPGSH